MAFNINDMRSGLALGGAKPSLFQVQISNPVTSLADLKAPFMIRAAALPASTLTPIEVPYFGRKIKVAGDRTFDPWTVTVINDEDFLVRNAMEQWMNSINSHTGNLRLATSYKAQATITQYGKSGNVLRVYKFHGLFPTESTAIAMDWETDAIETFDVTFQYDYWTVSGGVTGLAGTAQ
jgi:hypothetical protein